MIVILIIASCYLASEVESIRYFRELYKALNMNNQEKMKSLFEGKTEILYVELRHNAERVGMALPQFHELMSAGIKQGLIDISADGVVTLINTDSLIAQTQTAA